MKRRVAPSKGEIEAWKLLRALRAEGFAFRREHQLGRYWADFVCLRRKLIVEIDGPLHETAQAQAHDAMRDAWLMGEGFLVMRIREGDVLSGANWLGQVRAALQARAEYSYSRRSPHPLPPPHVGEGEQSQS